MKRLLVILGVMSLSTGSILVRWSTMPVSVLMSYRIGITIILLAPVVLLRNREELRRAERKTVLLSLAGGVFLGLQLITGYESLRFLSVATAVVLMDTEVLFVALATVLIFRKRLSAQAWFSIMLAFGGSVMVAAADMTAGENVIQGNILALSAALSLAIYTMIGSVCRRNLSNIAYSFFVCLSAGGTVLSFALFSGAPLKGYDTSNYLIALAMAVLCTLLGMCVLSWGLKDLPPTFVSVARLTEPLFAAV